MMTIMMDAPGAFDGYIETLSNGLARIDWQNTRAFEYQVLNSFHPQVIEPRIHCVCPPVLQV